MFTFFNRINPGDHEPNAQGGVSDSDSDDESDSDDQKEDEIDANEWVSVCMRAVLPRFLVEVEPVKNGFVA